ncbi:hypothetical protein CC79DRAFT_1069743 [Sarocladium strictum]
MIIPTPPVWTTLVSALVGSPSNKPRSHFLTFFLHLLSFNLHDPDRRSHTHCRCTQTGSNRRPYRQRQLMGLSVDTHAPGLPPRWTAEAARAWGAIRRHVQLGGLQALQRGVPGDGNQESRPRVYSSLSTLRRNAEARSRSTTSTRRGSLLSQAFTILLADMPPTIPSHSVSLRPLLFAFAENKVVLTWEPCTARIFFSIPIGCRCECLDTIIDAFTNHSHQSQDPSEPTLKAKLS